MEYVFDINNYKDEFAPQLEMAIKILGEDKSRDAFPKLWNITDSLNKREKVS